MDDQTPDFSGPNERALDLLQPALTGDIVQFGEQLRDATQFEAPNAIVWILAISVLLSAISNFVRRTGDAARPVIEVVAEKMRGKDGADG